MIGDQLQRAFFSVLAGAAIAGGRIYDKPPAPSVRVFPDVTIGDEQVIEDGSSCGAAWEIFNDVHVWSRSPAGSKSELKQLVAQIVPLLATPLILAGGFRVVAGNLETSRSFRDPDGLTEHAILTFRHLVDET